MKPNSNTTLTILTVLRPYTLSTSPTHVSCWSSFDIYKATIAFPIPSHTNGLPSLSDRSASFVHCSRVNSSPWVFSSFTLSSMVVPTILESSPR